MKKQVSPNIKAHLIRGAFYLMLLLTVCIISFALAQRTPSKRNRPANTITVTNTNDSGPGSLRQALADANDGDTINFAVTGTIGLTSGELLAAKDITISGPGAGNLAINGNANSRVFHIGSGQTVTISGLTITNGAGGGIYNDHAALTLNDCTITGNSSSFGAIHNDGTTNIGHATLQINNSLITSNSGDGIYNDAIQAGTATLVIIDSTLSNNGSEATNNHAWSCLFCGNGTTSVQITNSSIIGNGGAIYSDTGRQNCGSACPVTISITNSTISGNGGGVHNSTQSDAVVSNSTISDNGFGIYNDSGAIAASVYNTTMNNNGVEIQNFNAPVIVTISNTIFNVSSGGHSILNDNVGTVTSYGYNVSSDDGGGYLNATGDQININPLLGPLQNNGGLTFTHALLRGSPAINAGDPNFVGPPDYDQRGPGYDRVRNGRLDVGSFEVQQPLPTPTATVTASVTPTPTLTATPTSTRSPCPCRTPSPKPRPTPAPRPTLPPRLTPPPTPTGSPRPTPAPRP